MDQAGVFGQTQAGAIGASFARGAAMTVKRSPYYRGTQPRKLRNAQKPQGLFIFYEVELVESAAFRCLSRDEFMVLCRIYVEHINNNRTENGLLSVTYANFKHWGIRQGNIRTALIGLRILGFIKMQDGRGGKGHSHPNTYTLTFLGDQEGMRTNDWKAIRLPDGESLAAFRIVMRKRIDEAVEIKAARRNRHRKPTQTKTRAKPFGPFPAKSAKAEEKV
jgi:hypothetical protein